MKITIANAQAGQIYPTAATWDYSLGGRVLDDPAPANLAPYDPSQIVLYSIVAGPGLTYGELDPLLADTPLDATLHAVSGDMGESQGYIRLKGIAWRDSAGTVGNLLDEVEDDIAALWRNIPWRFEAAQTANLARTEDGSLAVGGWRNVFGSSGAVSAGRRALVDLWESTSQKYRDAEAWLAEKADELEQFKDDMTSSTSDLVSYAGQEIKSAAFWLILLLFAGLFVYGYGQGKGRS